MASVWPFFHCHCPTGACRAGSIGRIVFPLLVTSMSSAGTLYLASSLSIALIPAIIGYIHLKRRRDVVREADAALAATSWSGGLAIPHDIHTGARVVASL